MMSHFEKLLYKFLGAADFVIEDWQHDKFRFVIEAFGFFGNLAAAIVLMWTSPTPPMHIVYPLWLSAAVCLMYAAKSRGSTALVAMFGLYLIIDSIGFIKAL